MDASEAEMLACLDGFRGLGEEGFSSHYACGRALSREEAVSPAGRIPPRSPAVSR
ncbi:hypothetical protein [Planomonospora sp. ID82291]|uniref:hypothetical protein n=1 Tax=Planomonospora sp. ID82291 TaxID=2738136 RepID=UPI0018C3FDAB|nr:hypothetical protein [Planomonospora sp. ID82291]MBG0818152.1 hypothetical protein [Planomonospora sp. ID82291]